MDHLEELRQIENHPNASDATRIRARTLRIAEEQRREQATHEQRVLARMDRRSLSDTTATRQGSALVLKYTDHGTAARRADELAPQVGKLRSADISSIANSAKRLDETAKR